MESLKWKREDDEGHWRERERKNPVNVWMGEPIIWAADIYERHYLRDMAADLCDKPECEGEEDE